MLGVDDSCTRHQLQNVPSFGTLHACQVVECGCAQTLHVQHVIERNFTARMDWPRLHGPSNGDKHAKAPGSNLATRTAVHKPDIITRRSVTRAESHSKGFDKPACAGIRYGVHSRTGTPSLKPQRQTSKSIHSSVTTKPSKR